LEKSQNLFTLFTFDADGNAINVDVVNDLAELGS